MNNIGNVLAYFLTWTTYGTWLPGDKRGWIKYAHAGVQSPSWKLEEEVRERMVESSVLLSDKQRNLIEKTIQRHCGIRRWHLHATNARTNHVHVVITSNRNPEDTMNQLKAYCSRALSDDAGLIEKVAHKAGRRRWFTEGGDKELIHDEDHLRSVIRYVLEGQ